MDPVRRLRLGVAVFAAVVAIGGHTFCEAHVRDRTDSLVVAIRAPDGRLSTDPEPETSIQLGHVLMVIGRADQVAAPAAAWP